MRQRAAVIGLAALLVWALPASVHADAPSKYAFDDLGRLASVTTELGTTKYRYFESGSIEEMVDPDGRRYSFTDGNAPATWATASPNFLPSFAAAVSSPLDQSGNPFLFAGYVYERELSAYVTPSGRYYDPAIGRFLQQDTVLGDITNPPSLHRYAFGHVNPTSFIDPTGHESYRQWILLDKPSASVGHEFLKNFGYNAFNVLSFGALGRQDALVEKSEAGRITENQYIAGTAINTAGTAVVTAATFATGGAAGQAAAAAGGSAVLGGAAGGGAAGLVASTGSANIDMATGTRSPLDIHPTEFVGPTLLGAATGAVFGAGSAAGVRPFGESALPPPSLNSSRPVLVAEGQGGPSAADCVALVPAMGRPIPAGRGQPNPIGEQGPFIVSQSGVATTQRGIVRLDRPGFAEFEGMEVRGVRDLSHLSENTLRAMQEQGFAARDANGTRLELHHHQQNPAGPLVEIPAGRHRIGNPQQHPLGNAPGAGLSSEQRAAFNQWRTEYWKARATEELARRGAQ